MKSAYIALGYKCNENCSFCPCSKLIKQEKKLVNFLDIKKYIYELSKFGIREITFSGGEPTLHPDFINIVAYVQSLDIKVFVLSNSERFSDASFVNLMQQSLEMRDVNIITTIHSHKVEEHEAVNGTKGSFNRTVQGLLKLLEYGSNITLKHCITSLNYKDLSEFYTYFNESFPEQVDMQFCSIDYSGIEENLLQSQMLSFVEMKSHLENMLDEHIKMQSQGNKRRIYCINIPLCASDVYYWRFMNLRKKKSYEKYVDPYSAGIIRANDNVIIDDEICKDCKVKQLCPGTYKSAFEYFGEKLVRPILG